jgi:hypothetical protein
MVKKSRKLSIRCRPIRYVRSNSLKKRSRKSSKRRVSNRRPKRSCKSIHSLKKSLQKRKIYGGFGTNSDSDLNRLVTNETFRSKDKGITLITKRYNTKTERHNTNNS